MLSSLEHHELLVFWVQLLVIFGTARILGTLARRIGLPGVIGHLFAGVVLGPSVFGLVWSNGFDWFLPESEVQSALLLAVSWLSAAFLLVVAGFETDLKLIERLGSKAAFVTIGSMAVPFAGGLAVASQMPESLFGYAGNRRIFMLFIAITISVSALAVIAKILGDLGLMRRDVGQLMVAAGMANDLIGWVVLGILAGLAASGQVSATDIGLSVLGLAIFMALALTLGQFVVDAGLRAARQRGANRSGALTVTMGAMLVFGVATQWLGVEAVLGAFVAGVVLVRSRYQQSDAIHMVEDITGAVFAPLFFATAGLRLDLGLLRGEALTWTLILVACALGFKFLGSYGGARVAGLTNQEGLVLGAGLNARGALEIVIATVGLTVGVFNQTSFTMIVVIPIVTSLIASIGVRLFSRDLKGSVSERERLAREKAMASNLVVRNGRLLLPTHGGDEATVATHLVHGAWPDDLDATILAMRDQMGSAPDLDDLERVLEGREFDVVDVQHASLAERMVRESHMGYAVAAVGISHEDSQKMLSGEMDVFFSPFVDRLLNRLHIPLVLVKHAIGHDGENFSSALVPIDGSTESRAAQELAASISANLKMPITFTNVVRPSTVKVPEPVLVAAGGPAMREETVKKAQKSARDIDTRLARRVLSEAAAQATRQRATYRTEVRVAGSPGEDVLAQATEDRHDLIVLGADLRRVDGRPYLGRTVEFVLKNASQTVAVVVMPPKGSKQH